MSDDSKVADLLIDWEEARARGEDLSAIDLCIECPELTDEVARRIGVLRALQPVLETSNSAETVSDATDTLELPGFEVLGVLGRGGMGVVYKTRQLNLNRIVAVKMIRATAVGDSQLARFRTEAEAVAQLQHPNIVHIHEINEFRGQPYLVLEFVDGETLAQRLSRSPIPYDVAAGIAQTLAEAVQAAHQHGVIHRDIKPSNVLITRAGVPKITDFGLAKRLDEDSALTRTGDVMGTPSYMAPEQVRGDSQQTSVSTDIYAVGATLYEMLTGRPPFVGSTALETFRQIIEQEVVPPIKLQPGLPRDLDTICLKCLEKRGDQRYESAVALADDLERFHAGQPVRARPVSRIGRLIRWARRHPARAGLISSAVIAFAALVAVAVGTQYQRQLEVVNDDLSGSLDREQKLTTQLQGALRSESHTKEMANYVRRIGLAHSLWRRNDIAGARRVLAKVPRQMRHFEWHYVDRLCNSGVLELVGHRQQISGIAFSPNGMRIASIGHDNTVILWDTQTGQQQSRLRFPRIPRRPGVPPIIGRPSGIAWSPDGKRLAAGYGFYVHVWDTKTQRVIRKVRLPYATQVENVVFSTDGSKIAARSSSHLAIWNTSTWKAVLRTSAPMAGTRRIRSGPRLNRDGTRVFFTTLNFRERSDHRLAVEDVTADREITTQSIPYVDGHVEFSADATRIAASSRKSGPIRVLDTKTRRVLHTMRGHQDGTFCCAFSPDGRFLASGGFDRLVKVWDAERGKQVITHRGHKAPVTCVSFSADGSRIAAGANDGSIRIWDSLTRLDRRFVRHSFKSYSAFTSFLGDEETLICCGYGPDLGHHFVIRDATQKTVVQKLHDGRNITDLSHRPGRATVAVVDAGLKVELREFKTGKHIRFLQGKACLGTTYACFDAQGRLVAAHTTDGDIRVWDVSSGTLLHTFKDVEYPQDYGMSRVQFTANGRLMAACDGKTIGVWDMVTGRRIRSLRGHQRRVSSVGFSPDGNRIASAGLDGTVRVWDVQTGKAVAILRGHWEEVNCVTYSPDGKRIVSAGRDRTLRIWDTTTGLETLTLEYESWDCTSIAISSDGKRLVSSDSDGVKIWDARSGKW